MHTAWRRKVFRNAGSMLGREVIFGGLWRVGAQ
jgi:hypothetical protein